MEASELRSNIFHLGSSGVVLSPERISALHTSLVCVQHEYKFRKVYFWGKILGTKSDYYIAQGRDRDEFAAGKTKTLYSKDCVHWGLLPTVTKAMRENCKLAKGRFTGDPSYEFEHISTKKTGEGEEQHEEEETMVIKEEDRLASVICEIEEDVVIVPRGSFVKEPTGETIENRCFEGLTVSEAAKLSSYMHFREPVVLNEKSLLQKANLDKSIDFLDPIEGDIPKGCWSLQFEEGSGLVILRSLLWTGYVFFHVPGKRKFGSVYVGIGDKNMDLPFML